MTLRAELLFKVEVAWNGSVNIGAPGPLQRSHTPVPPVRVTTSLVPRVLPLVGEHWSRISQIFGHWCRSHITAH